MGYCVKPFKNKTLDIELSLPGSKSITNRCLLVSALAEGTTELNNVLFSDDTFYMMNVLQKLGIELNINEKERKVILKGGKLPEGNHSFFVGNAGTAMRFLTSYLSIGRGEFLLDGDERMRERPIQDLIDVLGNLGVDIKSVCGNGCPPVRIKSNGIEGGESYVVAKKSSQYISSILMSVPYANHSVILKINGELTSKPYIEMTLKIMKNFGVDVENINFNKFVVHPQKYISPGSYYIEPDASTASYFLAATAILSGRIKIVGLGRDSIQGDTYFAKILEMMGCKVEIEKDFPRGVRSIIIL